MATIRTFLAVDINERIRSAAGRAVRSLVDQCPDYTWVDRGHWHITLNFLGDVPDTQVPEICRTATSALAENESFVLHVRGVGCFPSVEKPRVIWLGIEEGASQMVQLNDRIATGLEQLGIPRERRDYVPHLTLGRLKRGGRWNAPLQDSIGRLTEFDAGICTVREVVVYSSFLDRGGPTYTPMARIPLDEQR